MLDFYADWCVSCKEMERYTFSNESVRRALSGAVLLKADVTANDERDRALLAHFGLFGPPAILFFGADGRERSRYRVIGFVSAKGFREVVESALDPPGAMISATAPSPLAAAGAAAADVGPPERLAP